MSASDKTEASAARPIAPHIAPGALYAHAPLFVTKRCAMCRRPATHTFPLPQFGARSQIFLCTEHKGHSKDD